MCENSAEIHGGTVDIYGISEISALKYSQKREEICKWPTAHPFVSWLNLVPIIISVGKLSAASNKKIQHRFKALGLRQRIQSDTDRDYLEKWKQGRYNTQLSVLQES